MVINQAPMSTSVDDDGWRIKRSSSKRQASGQKARDDQDLQERIRRAKKAAELALLREEELTREAVGKARDAWREKDKQLKVERIQRQIAVAGAAAEEAVSEEVAETPGPGEWEQGQHHHQTARMQGDEQQWQQSPSMRTRMQRLALPSQPSQPRALGPMPTRWGAKEEAATRAAAVTLANDQHRNERSPPMTQPHPAIPSAAAVPHAASPHAVPLHAARAPVHTSSTGYAASNAMPRPPRRPPPAHPAPGAHGGSAPTPEESVLGESLGESGLSLFNFLNTQTAPGMDDSPAMKAFHFVPSDPI